MIRGTTTPLSFEFPCDISEALTVWLTFSQNGKEVFTLEKNDMTFSGNIVKCRLTQQQTLSLNRSSRVKMQFRILIMNNGLEDAWASDEIDATVHDILKDGEITKDGEI